MFAVVLERVGLDVEFLASASEASIAKRSEMIARATRGQSSIRVTLEAYLDTFGVADWRWERLLADSMPSLMDLNRAGQTWTSSKSISLLPSLDSFRAFSWSVR
jgi:hypothetical protein